MELVHEMTYHAMLRPPVDFGAGPFGTRMYFEVTEGSLTGPRVNGTWIGGGGDWVLVGPGGRGRLDVRAQLATDDGAFVFAQYFGVLEMNDALMSAMATGSGTDYGDQYFRTTPRFETGDERYAWMTQSVFVGEGRLLAGLGVEYQVFRVT